MAAPDEWMFVEIEDENSCNPFEDTARLKFDLNTCEARKSDPDGNILFNKHKQSEQVFGDNLSLCTRPTLVHAFSFFEIVSGVGTVSQHSNDIHDREIPLFFIAVPYSSDHAVIENLYLILLCHTFIKTSATVSCRDKVTLRDSTPVAELKCVCESVTNHLCKIINKIWSIQDKNQGNAEIASIA